MRWMALVVVVVLLAGCVSQGAVGRGGKGPAEGRAWAVPLDRATHLEML